MRLCCAVLTCTLFATACSPTVRKCAKDTLFVAITIDSGVTADTLLVDVSIAGAAPTRTTLSHGATAAQKGGIEVDFAHYPAGQSVTVTISAVANQLTVGTGSASQALDGSCASMAIEIKTVPSAGDMASGADLFGRDLAANGDDLLPNGDDLVAPDDLAAPDDLVGADLTGGIIAADMTSAPADLKSGADMVKAENCFNNIDDDGDGFVDCADTDCTGGATPVAECVPDPNAGASGTPGVLLPGLGTCPPGFPTTTKVFSNFVDTQCNTGACASTGGTAAGRCNATYFDYGSSSSCGSPTQMFQVTTDAGCVPLSFQSTDRHFGFFLGFETTSASCTAGGAPDKVDAHFQSSQNFCAATVTSGAGCASNKVCLPATSAGPHCTIKSNGSSCPTGYSANEPDFFTGAMDAKTCKCVAATSSATCQESTWKVYASSGCNGPPLSPIDGCDASDLSALHSTSIGAPSNPISCNALVVNDGGASGTVGPQKICCAP